MGELALQNSRLDGRYDIQRQLGQGSYAEIFVARDVLASTQSPHHTVVIKALNVFLQNDLDADLERTLVENFQNEAIALDRVRHPNVINRLGHGSARDLHNTVFHYLVLEYLSGGDLAKLCRERHLTLVEALDYLEQVCAGLGHAHANGIIHRDIKPQNLLLTADQKIVKIADFGVARVTASESPITRVGTNMYAPPEHSPLFAANDDALIYKKLTPAADIYSLAKSAYVLITGESPRFFANQPITELPFAMRQKPWAQKLVEVLNKATRSDSRERQQTVVEFWQDLSQIKTLAAPETGEISEIKHAAHQIPQAHVAVGYTPLAPQKPRFKTSQDIKLKNEPLSERAPLVVPIEKSQIKYAPPEMPAATAAPVLESFAETVAPTKKNSFVRRFMTLAIFILAFAGILYSTHNYLRGRGVLPSIGNPFATQTATANGDVYLRSAPNTNDAPVGLISKNSRLKIVNSQDNWYEVDITEYGRPKEKPEYVDHGWVSGKYIDVKE